jgi:hypothetical protein
VPRSVTRQTRTAFEAVRTLLPDWRLVHPVGPAEVAALAAAPPPRAVVWLDELQRYLDGEHGLTSGVVRALLKPRTRLTQVPADCCLVVTGQVI